MPSYASVLLAFLALFAVSAWTKETTILMTFAYCAMFFDRIPRRRFAAYLVAQVGLYAVAFVALRWLFRNNDGGSVEAWYREQLAWFLRKPLQRLVLLSAGAGAVAFAWSSKPKASSSLDGHAVFPTWPCSSTAASRPRYAALYESFPILFLLGFQNAALAARFAFSRITSRTAATTRAGDSGDDAGIGGADR